MDFTSLVEIDVRYGSGVAERRYAGSPRGNNQDDDEGSDAGGKNDLPSSTMDINSVEPNKDETIEGILEEIQTFHEQSHMEMAKQKVAEQSQIQEMTVENPTKTAEEARPSKTGDESPDKQSKTSREENSSKRGSGQDDKKQEKKEIETNEMKSERREAFTKLDDTSIANYAQSVKAKSFLSETMKNDFLGASTYNTRYRTMTKATKTVPKEIKVYFFKTAVNANVLINEAATVEEAILEIIKSYKKSNLNQELLLYPNNPEAYEIRPLEDDEGYEPTMPALKRNGTIADFNVNAVAFVEAPQASSMENKPTDSEKMIKILNEKNEVILSIECKDQGFTTKIPIQRDKLIRDAFATLTKKFKKLNPRDYIIRIPGKDFDEEPEVIEMNLPVNKLRSYNLEAVKRAFADDPKEEGGRYADHRPVHDPSFRQLSETQKGAMETEEQQYMFLFNEVSASKYEEFQVTKINQHNKKQDRLLGIDRFKIYNKKIPSTGLGIDRVLDLFMETAQHPERLMEDVLAVKYIDSNTFQLDVREKDSSKTLVFKTLSKEDTLRIVAKIKTIKNLEASSEKKLPN